MFTHCTRQKRLTITLLKLEIMSIDKCNPFTWQTLFCLQTIQLILLTFVSGWWAFSAWKKYSSEPLTTHIFYTNGDQDGHGIKFPQVQKT